MSAPPYPGPKGPPTDNRGPLVLITLSTLCGLATVTVALRIFARLKYKGRLYMDDWLMIFAMIVGLISAGLVRMLVEAGYGQHVYYLRPDQLQRIAEISLANQVISIWSGIIARVSFAASLIMIIGITRTRLSILWFVIVSQLVSATIFSGFQIFRCKPIAKSWKPMLPGECIPSKYFRIPGYILLSSIVVADLILALMPALIISQLRLKRNLKYGLVFLMSLGLVNCAAAIVSLVELGRLQRVLIDPTYATVPSNIWGGIQFYIVVVAGSAPFLLPIISNNPKLFSLSYFRSILNKSSRGRASGPSGDSPVAQKEGDGKLESLPHIPQSRFATTTLQHAGPGMDKSLATTTDSLSTVEEGLTPPVERP